MKYLLNRPARESINLFSNKTGSYVCRGFRKKNKDKNDPRRDDYWLKRLEGIPRCKRKAFEPPIEPCPVKPYKPSLPPPPKRPLWPFFLGLLVGGTGAYLFDSFYEDFEKCINESFKDCTTEENLCSADTKDEIPPPPCPIKKKEEPPEKACEKYKVERPSTHDSNIVCNPPVPRTCQKKIPPPDICEEEPPLPPPENACEGKKEEEPPIPPSKPCKKKKKEPPSPPPESVCERKKEEEPPLPPLKPCKKRKKKECPPPPEKICFKKEEPVPPPPPGIDCKETKTEDPPPSQPCTPIRQLSSQGPNENDNLKEEDDDDYYIYLEIEQVPKKAVYLEATNYKDNSDSKEKNESNEMKK